MVFSSSLLPTVCACIFSWVFALGAAFGSGFGRWRKQVEDAEGSLYSTLLSEETCDVEGRFVVPSRGPLACRQVLMCSCVIWSGIACAWAARKGEWHREGSLEHGLLALTWLGIVVGDASATHRLFFGADGSTFLRRTPKSDVSTCVPLATIRAPRGR